MAILVTGGAGYLSLVDRFHHRRIDIYSYDFETVSGSNGCRRKADIP